MSFQKKKYDIEMQSLMTLSQKASIKNPELADYSCNLLADRIALIDVKMDLHSDDPEFIQKLTQIRRALIARGRALWIEKSDPLTNLGFLVGRTGIRDAVNGKRTTSK